MRLAINTLAFLVGVCISIALGVAYGGQWTAQRGWIVTSPSGVVLACRLGEAEEPLPAGILFFDCTLWRETLTFYALPDGTLAPRLQ